MNIVAWVLLQFASYGLWWIAFIGIAFVCAKNWKWIGMFSGHFVIAALIFVLDVTWIRSEMAKPEWSPDIGPDMDIVFSIGMFIRIFLVNLILLPLSIYLIKKKSPNKAVEPTIMAVTDAAAQPPRQP